MSCALSIVELHVFEVLELSHGHEVVALTTRVGNGLIGFDSKNIRPAILELDVSADAD